MSDMVTEYFLTL